MLPRSLPLAAWPEADRQLWSAAVEPGADLLEADGPRARCRPISNAKFAFGYGCWLAWLSAIGELDPALPPGDRITSERVEAYLGDLATVNSTSTQLSRLEELYGTAHAIDPTRDWRWIRRKAARVRSRHVPMRNKTPRLVGSDDLYDLGWQLMKLAAEQATPRQRAIHFRDGLMIALLAARPLRRRNFSGLQLDKHLIQRGGGWWLEIAAAETKTRTPIEMPLPESLVPQLTAYLTEYRPFLCRQQGRWSRPVGAALWVSSNGSAMASDALYDRIVRRTQQAFGRSVNPHLFRDCAVTSLAIRDPGHIGIAASLLGHQDEAIAERHYNQACNIEAAGSLQAVLAGLRDGTLAGRDILPVKAHESQHDAVPHTTGCR